MKNGSAHKVFARIVVCWAAVDDDGRELVLKSIDIHTKEHVPSIDNSLLTGIPVDIGLCVEIRRVRVGVYDWSSYNANGIWTRRLGVSHTFHDIIPDGFSHVGTRDILLQKRRSNLASVEDSTRLCVKSADPVLRRCKEKELIFAVWSINEWFGIELRALDNVTKAPLLSTYLLVGIKRYLPQLTKERRIDDTWVLNESAMSSRRSSGCLLTMLWLGRYEDCPTSASMYESVDATAAT